MDWTHAENRLKDVEKMYTEIGSAGYLALVHIIRPLRDRLNSGEQTEGLYEAIMALE